MFCFSAIAAHVEEYQSIVKQFAKLLEFVLIFDECKMETPALQNDFSYYRRTSQRMRNANRLSSVNPEGSAIQVSNSLKGPVRLRQIPPGAGGIHT